MRNALRITALVALASSGVIAQEPVPFASPKAEPRIVTAGRTSADPPSDAIVLFDGKDLSGWRGPNGAPAKWTIRDGYAEVVAGTGDITTTDGFGDVQLHIEWATPAAVKGEGQERGNSGVFLMERYEIQILDSYDNKTYFHGQRFVGRRHHTLCGVLEQHALPRECQRRRVVTHRARRHDGRGH